MFVHMYAPGMIRGPTAHTKNTPKTHQKEAEKIPPIHKSNNALRKVAAVPMLVIIPVS